MKEVWRITHADGMTEQATVEQFSDGEWFVDMGCSLWNRSYKSYGWARKYLERNGYSLVSEEDVLNENIAELEEVIQIAEKCKNAYFWTPEKSAGGRRWNEKKYSKYTEWEEGGHEWSARTIMEQSCHNVYFRTEYTKDNKKTNLTAVRNSLERMKGEVKCSR